MKALSLALILCLPPGVSHARCAVSQPVARSLTLNCMADAAREQDVPLAALVGILAAEGGKVGEAQRNDNGSWDLGPFQVNTCNLNDLACHGFTPEAILRDGCVNARAAARLLRRECDRAGNIWDAIGAYHSRTPKFRDAYIAKVKKRLIRMARMERNSRQPDGVLP